MPVSVGLNYLLVYGPHRYRLGFIGAPIAVVIAYYCIFFVMLVYALLTTPKVAWCGLSRAIVQDLGVNVRLGLAGVLSLCSEWWGEHMAKALPAPAGPG
jgi:MATE family multidrug resistance protein